MAPQLSLDEAEELWQEAVNLYNSNDKQDNQKAIEVALRILNEAPLTPDISSELKCLIADTYTQNLKEHDKAIEYYLKALEDDPHNSLAGSNLGFVYLQYKEDYEAAVKVLQETLDRGVSKVFIRESTKDWLAKAKKQLGK